VIVRDQIYNPLLCVCISLNITLSCAERAMAGQHLNVTQRTANR